MNGLTKELPLEKIINPTLNTSQKWHKVYYLIFAAMVIGVSILLLNSFLLKNEIPANFHIEGSKLIIVDNNNNNLWEYYTGIENIEEEKAYREHFQFRRKRIGYSNKNLPHIIIKDINNDNQKEILFSTQTQDEFGEGELICFSHKGNQVWRFRAGEELKFGPKVYSQDYRIMGFDAKDLDGDGHLEIIIIAYHRYYFPTQLIILNSNGNKIGEFWNSGQFSDFVIVDLDNDWNMEIVIAGINNEYEKGCLVVFDTSLIEGCSPNDDYFRCENFKPGSEKFYIIFPRTDVDLLVLREESIVQLDILSNRRLSLLTTLSHIFFELDFNLKLQDIRLSNTFRKNHKVAFLEGKVDGPLDEIKYTQNLAQGLLYYDGQNWVSTPTMTSYWKNKALNH